MSSSVNDAFTTLPQQDDQVKEFTGVTDFLGMRCATLEVELQASTATHQEASEQVGHLAGCA